MSSTSSSSALRERLTRSRPHSPHTPGCGTQVSEVSRDRDANVLRIEAERHQVWRREAGDNLAPQPEIDIAEMTVLRSAR